MYICPECGKKYDSVPDTCSGCGKSLADLTVPDPFHAAAQQEKKAAEHTKAVQSKYQQDAKDAAAEVRAAAKAEQKKADSAERRKKSVRRLKIAALCGAVLIGSGAIAHAAGFRINKPRYFEKSTLGTFYMKECELWFQDGRNGKTYALNDALFESDEAKDNYLEMYGSTELKNLIQISPDGKTVYYPKEIAPDTNGNLYIQLMSRSLLNPDTENMIAEKVIVLPNDDHYRYGVSALGPFYMPELMRNQQKQFMSNTIETAEENTLPMDPAYLICGDAVYYRNGKGAFCCTEGGATTQISEEVQRFWLSENQDTVFYIALDNLNNYCAASGNYWIPSLHIQDSECMRIDSNIMINAFGTVLSPNEENGHIPPKYALSRTAPGMQPEKVIEGWFLRWLPIAQSAPKYFYYQTNTTDDEHNVRIGLSRIDLNTFETTTIYDGTLEDAPYALRGYPDGSCFFLRRNERPAISMNPEEAETELESDDPDPDASEPSPPNRDSSIMIMPTENIDSVDWEQRAFEALMKAEFYYYKPDGTTVKVVKSIYPEPETCQTMPYLIQPYVTDNKRLYYLDEPVVVRMEGLDGNKQYPELSFSQDGTVLFGNCTEYDDYSDFTDDPYALSYIKPTVRLYAGILNGTEPVEMKLVSAPEDEACVLPLELPDGQPDELIRFVNGTLYAGEEVIAENVRTYPYVHETDSGTLSFITGDAPQEVPENEPDNPNHSTLSLITLDRNYSGTLIARRNRQMETIAENVTDFLPGGDQQYLMIRGEAGEAGTLYYRSGDVTYQVDEGATDLLYIQKFTAEEAPKWWGF